MTHPSAKENISSKNLGSFKTDSSLGIVKNGENEFTPLMFNDRPNVEIQKLAETRQFKKWENFSGKLLKKENWGRLGQLAKAFTHLPEDVAAMFDKLEKKSKFVIEQQMRLFYYQDFTRAALGSTTLHFRDVEKIIRRRNADIHIGPTDLYTLMTSKLEQSAAASGVHSEHNEYFDFEHFVALIHELLLFQNETTLVEKKGWSLEELARQLPLDPDSGGKRIWDIFILVLLLYCSFSVPYSIAFDDTTTGTTDGSVDTVQAIAPNQSNLLLYKSINIVPCL